MRPVNRYNHNFIKHHPLQTVNVKNARVPAIGYGTWQVKDQTATRLVEAALDLGYRHIDTAQIYQNEAEVGKGLANAAVPREEVFLTTKVWMTNYADGFEASVQESLRKLGTDYVDLLLLHWPTKDLELEAYVTPLMDMQRKGYTKHIGVSNFLPEQMRRTAELGADCITNQVEYHPLLHQREVIDTAAALDWFITAYSPLAQGKLRDQPVLQRIAEQHDRSIWQVALRWLLQQPDTVVLPRTTSEAHLRDNFEVFDFELTESEMRQIFALTKQNRKLADPDFAPDWHYAPLD